MLENSTNYRHQDNNGFGLSQPINVPIWTQCRFSSTMFSFEFLKRWYHGVFSCHLFYYFNVECYSASPVRMTCCCKQTGVNNKWCVGFQMAIKTLMVRRRAVITHLSQHRARRASPHKKKVRNVCNLQRQNIPFIIVNLQQIGSVQLWFLSKYNGNDDG